MGLLRSYIKYDEYAATYAEYDIVSSKHRCHSISTHIHPYPPISSSPPISTSLSTPIISTHLHPDLIGWG